MCRSIVILGLVLSLLGTSCEKSSTPTSQPGASTIKLQLNWKPEPQFGGFYAAQVNGAYARHNLNVVITPGGAGAPTIDMVGAGTVPFAIVSGDEIIRARANGNLVVALFAVFQTNPQGIMTRASRGFKTIADVFSHEGMLAMERGLPYSDFLKNKYTFDKLKVVPSPFGDLSIYRTDPNYAMQCFVTSEPLAAKRAGIEPQTFLIAEAGYNPYTTVLSTSESYLKANPQIVKAMIQAVRDGWNAYQTDSSKTNEAMAKLNPTMDAETFKLGAEAQKALIQTESPNGADIGTMNLDRWKTLVQQLTDLKVITKPVKAEECFVDVTHL